MIKQKTIELAAITCHVVAEQAVLLSLDGFLVVVDGLAVLVGLLQRLAHLGRKLRVPASKNINSLLFCVLVTLFEMHSVY